MPDFTIQEMRVIAENTALLTEKSFIKDIFTVLDSLKGQPVNIVELGTGYGSFTLALAVSCKENGGTVETIDSFGLQSSFYMAISAFEKIKTYGLQEYVKFIHSDDLNEKMINERFIGKKYDVIMIDTSHTYLQTIMELAVYDDFLKDEGYFILHDTAPGVKETNPTWGVREAALRMVKEKGYLIVKDNQEMPGLMIIKKWKGG